jgi:hypothetical protein
LNERERRLSRAWHIAKLVALIVLCVVLAALGGIGVALGLLSQPR